MSPELADAVEKVFSYHRTKTFRAVGASIRNLCGGMHHRATTIMVGIGATTMAGGIIAIGGDFSPQARGEAALVGGLFLFIQPLVSPIKDVRSWVAIADKPDMASTA